MLVPLIVSSVAAGLLSVTSYFPYKNHLKLHGDALDASSLGSDNYRLNLEHCQPVSTRLPNEPAGPVEPSFCEDIVLDRRTGVAYLSCDPTRLTWDARAGIYEDGSDRLASEQGTPGIWAWDTNRRNLPRKLFISSPPPEYPIQAPADLQSTFHPLGIAVTPSHPYFAEEADEGEEPRPEPPANLVLVANKPYADRPGVVDIFVHDLDKVGGKDHTTLRWIKRVQGDELSGMQLDWDTHFNVDPFRITVFEEQYSQRMDRHYPEPTYVKEDPEHLAGFQDDDPASIASKHIRIPSFFITSLPDRTAQPAPLRLQALVCVFGNVAAHRIDSVLAVLARSRHGVAQDLPAPLVDQQDTRRAYGRWRSRSVARFPAAHPGVGRWWKEDGLQLVGHGALRALAHLGCGEGAGVGAALGARRRRRHSRTPRPP